MVMLSRKLIYAMATVVMGVALGMMIGCGSTPVSDDSSNGKASQIDNYALRNQISEISSEHETIFEPVGPFVLENGTYVTITGVDTTATSIMLDIYYNINGQAPRITRRLSIDQSFTRFTIANADNSYYYEYGCSINSDTTIVSYSHLTLTDTLEIQQYSSGLRQLYVLNSDTIDVQFVNAADRDRAIWLVGNYDDNTILGMPHSDQGLYDQLRGISDVISPFDNNDSEAAVYMMSDSSFVHWTMGNYSVGESMDRSIACAIAGLLTQTCWCPACVLICVPATGISLACGIAEIGLWLSSN